MSLNEKQRGFPTGLRIIDGAGSKSCLLMVESSLESAQWNEAIPLTIRTIEAGLSNELTWN